MKTKIELIDISEIKENPNNPRIIKDQKFKDLVKSIKKFPEMLEIRPIVINAEMVTLGGNMRLKACKEAGLEQVPIIRAENLTEEQQKEFIIKDNVGYGEWAWDVLANEWDAQELIDWGLDMPDFSIAPTGDELTQEQKNKPATMKITFPCPEELQKCENEISEVINRLSPEAYYSLSCGEL